jgi:SAM-dependent methyltransferase
MVLVRAESLANIAQELYRPEELTVRTFSGLSKPPPQLLSTNPLVRPLNPHLPEGNLAYKDEPILFVSRQFRNNVRQNLNRAIVLDDLDGESFHEPYIGYMGQTLHALADLCSDIQSQVGLDLGCGSGLLSLAAISIGAEHIVGIEKNQREIERFAQAIAINGGRVGDRSRFDLINVDIQTLSIHDIPLANKISFVVANIGPQPDYGDTHLSVLSLLKQLPNIRLCILGGYYEENRERPHYSTAENQLKDLGFSVYPPRIWPPRNWQTPDLLSSVVIIARK